MYWFRQSLVHFMPFAVLFLLTWAGGWLLASHTLKVRPRERLLTGLAAGVILYISISNLLAHILPASWAFVTSAVVIFGLGLLAAWRSGKAWFEMRDLRTWPQIVVVLSIALVFTLMLRGLAIWDDYHNLPVVSTIAAGNLPPRYYLDPSFPLSYHYGLHIYAASLVSTGGLTPWSAWDIARGFTTALAIGLAWLWCRRMSGSDLAGYFGAGLLTFGGGTLWLIALLPGKVLEWVSAHTPLANSALDVGPSLAANLSRPFLMQGGPPVPIPFSFLGSLFAPTVVNWTGIGSLYLVSIFILLLWNERRRISILPILVSALVFSLVALNAEHAYGLMFAGAVLAAAAYALWNRRRFRSIFKNLISITAFLLLSLLLTLLQGGVFTTMLQNVFHPGAGGAANALGAAGFFFQWPPAVIADYFQPLLITNPAQMLVALAEIGPAILLIPIVGGWSWRFAKRGHVLEAGLGAAGLLGFIVPFIVHYGVVRDTSRISSFALQIFLIVSVPALVTLLRKGRSGIRALIVGGYGLSIIGGIVIFAALFTSVTTPQLSYFIDAQDGRMSAQEWNKLAPGALVLDRVPYRAVTLFGRMTRSSPTSGPVDFSTYTEWRKLIKDPDPVAVAAAGFRYVYLDDTWWEELDPIQRDALNQGCVLIVREMGDPSSTDWRRLLDVSKCK